MADSRPGAAELRGEPGARCSVGQEVLKKKKTKNDRLGTCQGGAGTSLKGLPVAEAETV